jgi:hypothetical protein
MPTGALDREVWGATVQLRPDDGLRANLLARFRAGPLEASVSVTELLEPRIAYWRRIRPVPPTPERASRMRAGQEMHVLAGHLLAPASAREIRSRREGIVARIDLLDDRVTELKTTALRDPGTPTSVRPAYLQQLAVYCGQLDRSLARLILIDPGDEGAPRVEAFDTEFPEAPRAWAESLRRADRLRDALARGTPAGLPRCPWWGRGCEFQGAGVCDCTGEEPEAAPDAFGPLPPVVPNAALATRLAEALAARPSPPAIRRFRDLLYPRRAYYERTVPLDEGEPAWRPPGGDHADDLWRQISDLLETGVGGEVASVDVPGGEPLERVATLAGRPMVLKTNRSWTPPPPDRVLEAQPQYVLELALRCALAGAHEGTLIVGYERIPDWERRLQIYRVGFDPPGTVQALADTRLRALREALEAHRPRELPSCPAWMYDGCPYKPDCGCVAGAGPGVDHR